MMTDSPYTFANLLGQEKAKELLLRSFAHGKLGHAYLFQGPDGVGKKRTAITLAAYINCRAPHGKDACGQCPSCRKFRSGNHPDLLIIRPEGSMIKIGQIRQLKHDLTFAPFEANSRVVILEDVHTMRREAANSLLKTLEEPPAGNILILTADEAGTLLPTIVSRCQPIAFHPLQREQVARLLTAEDGIAEPTAITLAAVAEGSLGQARMIWENGLLGFRQEVVENLLRLEPASPEAIGTVFQLAEKAAGLKEHVTDLFELLKIWLRDLMLLAAGGHETSIVSRDLADLVPAARQRWRASELAAKLLLLKQAERQLLRNCNRSLVCEVLLLNLI